MYRIFSTLSLFWDFEEAQEANWGQACLAYLYSSLDTLSKGTLRQVVRPWKLIEVSFLFFCNYFQAWISYPWNCIHPHVI